MNSIKIFVSIILLFASHSYAQNRTRSYCKSESYASICLTLNKDSTYSYSTNTCMSEYKSEGKYLIEKDTLILNSFIQKDNLTMSIETKPSSTEKSIAFFPILKNLAGDLMLDATIYINNDTTKHCMPAFDNDCNFIGEEIKSIKVSLSNNVTTNWYQISTQKKDTIIITLNLNRYLDAYIFFKSEKFILNSKTITPLVFNNNTYKRESYFLTLENKSKGKYNSR